MSQSINLNKYPSLQLCVYMEVKNRTKAERVMSLIQSAIGLPLYVEEIYKSDKAEYSVFCSLISESPKTNDSIVWALVTLNKIGEEWYTESPNLDHKQYWKFKGTRQNDLNAFKVNGIKKVDFELTNKYTELKFEKVIN